MPRTTSWRPSPSSGARTWPADCEYRTKRVILEIYDAMQQAMDTGESDQNASRSAVG